MTQETFGVSYRGGISRIISSIGHPTYFCARGSRFANASSTACSLR